MEDKPIPSVRKSPDVISLLPIDPPEGTVLARGFSLLLANDYSHAAVFHQLGENIHAIFMPPSIISPTATFSSAHWVSTGWKSKLLDIYREKHTVPKIIRSLTHNGRFG